MSIEEKIEKLNITDINCDTWVNFSNEVVNTPLILLCSTYEDIEYMIDRGADLNKKGPNERDRTLLDTIIYQIEIYENNILKILRERFEMYNSFVIEQHEAIANLILRATLLIKNGAKSNKTDTTNYIINQLLKDSRQNV